MNGQTSKWTNKWMHIIHYIWESTIGEESTKAESYIFYSNKVAPHWKTWYNIDLYVGGTGTIKLNILSIYCFKSLYWFPPKLYPG